MKINWLKVLSYGGMVLGFVGSIISQYADEKQEEALIDEKVEERVRLYFENNDEKTM